MLFNNIEVYSLWEESRRKRKWVLLVLEWINRLFLLASELARMLSTTLASRGRHFPSLLYTQSPIPSHKFPLFHFGLTLGERRWTLSVRKCVGFRGKDTSLWTTKGDFRLAGLGVLFRITIWNLKANQMITRWLRQQRTVARLNCTSGSFQKIEDQTSINDDGSMTTMIGSRNRSFY